MSDDRDDLLTEIGDALRVEPSPAFAAGVRTRIASEPAPGRSWTAWLVWGGVAAAVTASIAILAIRDRVAFSPPSPVTPAVVARVETPVVTEPPVVAAKSRRQLASASVPSAPEVLVPNDQLLALNRLLVAMRGGRADVPASPALTDPATGELLPMPPIVPLPGASDNQTAQKGREK